MIVVEGRRVAARPRGKALPAGVLAVARDQAVARGAEAQARFPAQIRAWRSARGLSLVELAYGANVSLDSLRAYEAGRREPLMAAVVRIAAAIGVGVDGMLFEAPPDGR